MSAPPTSSPPAGPLSSPERGRVLIDALIEAGVRDVVVSPGSRSAPLALAVAARPDDLRLHVRIDERTAAFLALGITRGSGQPAAVICSSGTATANYHPAVIEADAAGVALVVLTADRPASLRHSGANQTIIQPGLYGGATRFADDLGMGGAAYLRSVVAQAVSAARGTAGRPGPVHLNVPFDEPLLDDAAPGASSAAVEQVIDQQATGQQVARQPEGGLVLSWTPASGPSPGDVIADHVLGNLARAVIIAGEGAVDPDPEGALERAGSLGIPVLAEPTSGLRGGRPALRTGHWLAASEAFASAHRPSLVIQVGRPVLSRPVARLIRAADVVITLDPSGAGWDPQRLAVAVLRTSLSTFLAQVGSRRRPGTTTVTDDGWLAAWTSADRRASRALDAVLDGVPVPSELRTVRDLSRVLPDHSLLVVASSLVIRHLNEVQPPRAQVRVVGNRGASGIDGFVSTAIGAALGNRDGRTAALAGDLSVVHDLTGLVVGPDEPLPSLPLIVINNDGGGIFDLLPYGRAVDPATFRRLFATPHGMPFEGVAMMTGHAHTDIHDLTELGRAVEDAWSVPGVTILEVHTDTPTQTALHAQVADAVGEALSGS